MGWRELDSLTTMFNSTFDLLREKRAFRIDRHALKIVQPIKIDEITGLFRLDCKNDVGRRWGKIDFSRGFSAWYVVELLLVAGFLTSSVSKGGISVISVS